MCFLWFQTFDLLLSNSEEIHLIIFPIFASFLTVHHPLLWLLSPNNCKIIKTLIRLEAKNSDLFLILIDFSASRPLIMHDIQLRVFLTQDFEFRVLLSLEFNVFPLFVVLFFVRIRCTTAQSLTPSHKSWIQTPKLSGNSQSANASSTVCRVQLYASFDNSSTKLEQSYRKQKKDDKRPRPDIWDR